MRSLLLQLLSVLCFYGLLFTTGSRPASVSFSSQLNKKATKIAEPKKVAIKKVESIVQIAKPKSSSFTIFPKVPSQTPKVTNIKPVQKIKTSEAVPQKTRLALNDSDHTPQFQIAAETSLRKYPEPNADVLKRIGEGERVEIIESTERYWWKVNYAGRVGWVKRHLLIRA